MPRTRQTSFSGGVISPALHGQTDLAKYTTAVACAYNLIVKPEGGLVNRPGLHFAQQVKDSSAVGARLVPFQYNVEQQYALEFGDQYMRVIRNGSYVYEAADTITGATQADPVVLTVTNSYSNGDEVFVSGIAGMTELNNRSFLVANVTGTTVELQDLEGNDIDGSAYTAYSSGGTSERVYELTTPYAIADLQTDPTDPEKPGIKFTQSADTMTITHRSYVTRDLTRSDHDNWTLTESSFEPDQATPTNVSITVNTTGSETVQYLVTAFNEESGEESLAGRSDTTYTITGVTQANPAVVTVSGSPIADAGDEIEIDGVVGMIELNDRRFIVDGVSGSDITLRDEDSTGYTAYSSAGTVHMTYDEVTNSATSADNTISWTAAADADKYNIYKRTVGVFGYIGTTQGTTFTDDNIDEDQTDGNPKFRNPFIGTGNYPQTVTFFEQRKSFAGSTNKPQTMYLSQSAAFDNFTFSSPRKDSDAITRTLNARQQNEIRHLVPMYDLIVMTAGAEWVVSAGTGEVITPTSVIAKPQSYYGSSHVQPVIVGNSALFVLRQGKGVRDFGFLANESGNLAYRSQNRTILVPHLFEQARIVEMSFSADPVNVVWVVLDSGKFASLTYLPEQDIWGWCEHETRGDVESVCSIEESDGPTTYFLVKRVINGVTKRFIEYMKTREFDENEDAFFVDSGLTLDSPISISGFTNADPCVVTTATSHGLSNGDTVDIAGVRVTPDPDATDATVDDENLAPYKYDEINKNGWKVANVTSTTFELQDSDATDVDATSWRVYEEGGEVRAAVTTVSGLWHLAGASATSLANADVQAGLTVSSGGQVTLQDAASRVHVGLSYYSEMESLDIDFSTQDGTTESKKRRIPRCYFKVVRTRGLKAGPSRDKLTQMKSNILGFTTGTLGMSIRPTWNRSGRVVIRQDHPLPMEVIGLFTRPEVEGDT